jgi:hypothetical protein
MPLALSPHSSGLRSLPRIDCPPEPSPKIFYNGQDVTNKTTIVVIGQQIVLTANVDTGTLDSTPWTVQGIKTGGWAVQFDPARPEETMGKPLDPDLTTASPTFYWVASGTNVVTLTVIDSSGAKYNASTTFNVVAPAYVIPPPSKTSVGIVRGHILRYGVLGSAESTGVTITGTITAPSGFSGSQQWVQIIPEDQKSVMAFWKKVGGAVTAVCRAFGLDTRYPATTLPSLKDSPTVAEGFDSYLMWKPDNPNAIFVPIAHVTWGWTGEAILNAQDTWILNPDSPPFTSDFYQEPTHEFPKWSTNVTSRPCTTQ